MGMRKYQREIARNRLKALGVGNVNKKMRGKVRMSHGKARRMQQTMCNRVRLETLKKVGIQLWRRVLWGDLATEAYMAQCHPKELKRKRRRGFRYPTPADIKGTIRTKA